MSLIHAHHPDHADVDHTDVDQVADHSGDTDRAERLDAGAHGTGFGAESRQPSPSGVIDLRVLVDVGDSPQSPDSLDGIDPMDAADPIDRRDTDVEFSALGKSPTEARVELFSSLTRLEPTTVTGRMLERTPDPLDVAGFDALAGRLPYVAAAPTLSLPYAVDDPDDPAARERRPRRRPLVGAMAAGVLSAGFAVTLFAGPGLGSGGVDRSLAPTAGATAGITRDLDAGPAGVPAPAAPAGSSPRPARWPPGPRAMP